MREIVLLRHGKPEIPEKTCLGITDVPLSEEGRTEVYRLREEGLLTGISRIITSPLSRCRETAKILSDGKIPVTVEEDLREISMGAWDGLTFSEIKERFPEEYAARGEDIADYEVPGGESFRACQKRVYQAWQCIRTACDGNLLVVCHAGVIRCLISSIEHRDLSRLREIPVSCGKAIRIPDPVYDGLITAAGRSSRMGDFKPLMELGGRPAILRILDRFSEAGVRHTVVVTGRQAEDLKAAVRR
jgi:probable phosphoglycerate mutase